MLLSSMVNIVITSTNVAVELTIMCGVDSGGEDNRIFLICVMDVMDASALLTLLSTWRRSR